MKNNIVKVDCRTDSKFYCMRCMYYWRCDKANRCYGECYACDESHCVNNSNRERICKNNLNREHIERT